MEKMEKILENYSEEERAEIQEFLTQISEHKRQKMSDDMLVYDHLMQQIEAVGELCEISELEKNWQRLCESANTLSNLVTARQELLYAMELDE